MMYSRLCSVRLERRNAPAQHSYHSFHQECGRAETQPQSVTSCDNQVVIEIDVAVQIEIAIFVAVDISC